MDIHSAVHETRQFGSKCVYERIRDSTVGITTDYGFDGRSSIPGKGIRNFSPLHSVRAHPASYPMGTGGSLSGVKQPRREADHSPPCSAEVKNVGAIPPLSHSSTLGGA
jgi:hypothetical protein